MTGEAIAPDAGSPKAKVFISYSRKDMAFADRLEAALKARGFEPLIDRTEIYAFEEWWKRIEALIARADTVVFVLSPDSVASEVALKEVAFAASLNKRFAPIVCRRVADKAVPEALARLNFVFFDDHAQFEEAPTGWPRRSTTDIAWIRQHTEFGEQARRWASARPAEWIAAALARAGGGGTLDRGAAARRAGADGRDAGLSSARAGQAATRRRNVLTGSLAAGLVLAFALAGLAYWQRGIAVKQRGSRAERGARQGGARPRHRNFKLAQKTAESLVFDIAQGLRDVQGMSAESGAQDS